MQRLKDALPLIIGIALAVAIIAFCYHHKLAHQRDGMPPIESDTVTIIIRDTVTIVKPQPSEVSSVGLRRVTLPLWCDSVTDSADTTQDATKTQQRRNKDAEKTQDYNLSASDYNLSASHADSATVVLPIERKVYEDSTYRAVISGAFASLDSITVYPRREMQRITIRSRPRRWGLSVGIGYGFTPHGLQPYVGVSLGYQLTGW